MKCLLELTNTSLITGDTNGEPWVACPLEDGNYQLAFYKYDKTPADCEVVVLGATKLS